MLKGDPPRLYAVAQARVHVSRRYLFVSKVGEANIELYVHGYRDSLSLADLPSNLTPSRVDAKERDALRVVSRGKGTEDPPHGLSQRLGGDASDGDERLYSIEVRSDEEFVLHVEAAHRYRSGVLRIEAPLHVRKGGALTGEGVVDAHGLDPDPLDLPLDPFVGRISRLCADTSLRNDENAIDLVEHEAGKGRKEVLQLGQGLSSASCEVCEEIF